MNSMPFNSQFKEIKGQIFCSFEIIYLAISSLALNYQHILTFFLIQTEGYHLFNFRRCLSANWVNLSELLPTVHYFTFSMGFSVHSQKACVKWIKVQCSKSRHFETFAYETIIKISLWQIVSDKRSENN